MLTSNKNNEPILPFSINFYDGQEFSDNPFSGIVRPFHKLLLSGVPIPSIAFISCKTQDKTSLLGSFTHTQHRLLFFPGMNLSLANPPEDYLKKRKLDFYLDHISLDENFKQCHQTDISKQTTKHKLSVKKTKKINDSLYLWFVWLVTPDQLESLPATQMMFITGNEKERHHKLSLLFDVKHQDKAFSINLDEELEGSHYWHFEFFVHKEKIDHDPTLTVLGIHPGYFAGLPIIVSEDREIAQVKIKAIHLEGFNGTIFIRACKFKGSLPTSSVMDFGGEIPGYDQYQESPYLIQSSEKFS